MFQKPLVAYDGSEQSCKALQVGIGLAQKLGVDLASITVEEELPPYIADTPMPGAFITPEVVELIDEQRKTYYDVLTQGAVVQALEQGVTLRAAVVAGDEVDAVADYARAQESDLLLVGFHRHSKLVDRFLGSTAHGLTLAAPCCVLAVK
ncbi:MAG: universal stress protein [Armatimonadetes bacterium]|nr:universal stress protein [Armatimonadota bacterium]